ncbi:MAG: asparagine synthase (glutamine-hydrolyzing) [Salinibacterium sp.]|nr:asparagine synthase (glutamine-hydrolyzing) [Salinibacterium sp.]
MSLVCGISGAWSRHKSTEELTSRTARALETARHRGPDDIGLEVFEGAGTVALGSTRLAILDLSSAGHMPMAAANGDLVVTYNGEITNFLELRATLTDLGHTFRSQSDTEVLLAAWLEWGVECLPRLEGMFAFAMFDRRAETLTIARDVFGIKPLYYYTGADDFGFASEIEGIIEQRGGRPVLDWQTAHDYLRWGAYDHSARTFIAGVTSLNPGHYAILDLRAGTLGEPVRYWWPSVATTSDLSFDDAAARTRELILESIRFNLRSDVPVGVALSGGIDSSAIACAVRLLEPDYPLQTFSYVQPGFAHSEDAWIGRVVDSVGATAHYVSSTGDELRRDLDTLIRAQGEPFGSTSIYAQFRVFQLARENGVVVTLDGQGADELFAGYSGYPAQRLQSLLERGKFVAASRFLNAWGTWPDRSRQTTAMDAMALMVPRSLARSLSRLRNSRPAFLDDAALAEHGVEQGFPILTDERVRGGRLKSHLRSELTSRGIPALLRHGDRNSMHFSVESRVPFLSVALTDFVFSLPEDYLVGADGTSKNVLRAAMAGCVPDPILKRRDKVGFVTPEKLWMDIANQADDESHQAEIGMLARSVKGTFVADETDANLSDRQQWRVLNLRRWAQLLGVDAS